MGKVNVPSQNCIHVSEDLKILLRFADPLGLKLLPNKLQNDEVEPWRPEEFDSFAHGTIYLFRPEWVMGDLRPMYIERGAFAGTYSLPPGLNFAPIELYFWGDQEIEGVRRLGNSTVSFKRDYLAEPAHEIRPSPPEIETVYKQLCKHLLSTITVSGGGHRYHVCKEAAALAARMPTKPPFDYIPWPPPDLHKATGKRGK